VQSDEDIKNFQDHINKAIRASQAQNTNVQAAASISQQVSSTPLSWDSARLLM
jgi:hypothetical protein